MLQFLRGDFLNLRQRKKKENRRYHIVIKEFLQEAAEIEKEAEQMILPVAPASKQEIYNRIMKSISTY